MGTPDFGVPALKRLAASSHEIPAVVTKPDAPRGRGRTLTPPAIKTAAQELGLLVIQPESLKDPEFHASLAALEPDLFLVVAFSILPRELLAVPKYGSVNIHASLLPKYRGAAPIQWAIINGEETTGVSIFLLEPTVDTGGIVCQKETPVGPNETYGELYERLSQLGADAAFEALENLESGSYTPRQQDHTLATKAPKLSREDGRIDWTRPAEHIRNLIRGVTPAPGAFTTWNGKPFHLLKVDIHEGAPAGVPGEIVQVDPKEGVVVSTGDGNLTLTRVKPAGKKAMDGTAWLLGARPEPGESFEQEI